MAEYIKFRLTAAKVGVSMALLALIAGLTEKTKSGPPQINATPAAVNAFLKLDAAELPKGPIRHDFVSIFSFTSSLHRSLANLEKKVKNDYITQNKINATFLKIRDANAEFLKVKGTATNSSELGGLGPNAFIQGNGSVVSGAVSLNGDGVSHPLLQTPNGIIAVSVGANQDQFTLTIHNGTNGVLPAVQDVGGGAPAALTLKPGDNTLPAVQHPTTPAGQVHLQIFPNASAGFSEVVSVLVSLEPSPITQGQIAVVGQLFTGGV